MFNKLKDFRFSWKDHSRVIITAGLVAILFLAGLLGFVIIPGAAKSFKPVAATPGSFTTVSGNGGNAVMVGEYLYFVGNYVPAGEIKYKQNEYKKSNTYGGIYRVKMAEGMPEYNAEKYDTELYGDEQQIWTEDYECLVPKIAGYENSALWVFGEYLIYTSPNNAKNKYGELQTDKTDFFRVNLVTGKNNKKIYTSENTGLTAEDYTVASINGKIFLLCHDGSKLVRVSVNDKVGKIDIITENLYNNSFAFPIVTSYLHSEHELSDLRRSYAGIMQFVFYTENCDEDAAEHKGHDHPDASVALMRYRIFDGEKDELFEVKDYQPKVLGLSNSNLMFEITGGTPSGSKLYIVGNRQVGEEGDIAFVPEIDKSQFTLNYLDAHCCALEIYDPGEKFFFQSEQSYDFKFLSLIGNKLFRYDWYNGSHTKSPIDGNRFVATQIAEGIEKIIAVNAARIYYLNSGKVYVIDFEGTNTVEAIQLSTDRIDSVRITTFYTIREDGTLNNFGDMVFYIKTIYQLSGEMDEGAETKTIPVIVDQRGNEYLLCQLDETYLEEKTPTA